MSLELRAPDDDPGQYESVPDPSLASLLERVEQVENKAADATALDEVAGRLDRIETRLARPNARVEVKQDQGELEHKAFLAWCRKGADGLTELERKTLGTWPSSPSFGGWNLVPETFLRELMRDLVEYSPMRQVARVQQVAGNPVLLPKRTQNLTAGWVAEGAEHGLFEPAYDQQSIAVYECRVSVEITNQLLEDAAFDLGAELARDFAEEFARLESTAFVGGNGSSEPNGFRDEIATSGNAITANSIIGLYYAVPSVYASRGTWIMGRQSMAAVRLLRSAADGPFVWADSLVPGQPPTLLGRPVVEFPDLDVATGSPTPARVAFGDWNRAYRIFDRVGLEVLRDPYTRARNSIVVFHARKRVGGALVDSAAVAGLSG